jgi:oxygen-independent coproporphyrinogen-3 oxidase
VTGPPRSPRPPRAAGLYVHLPFCPAKCRYCGFNSRPAIRPLLEEYLEALGAEIASAGEELTGTVDTVYLGGGTPTVLSGKQLERLLGAVRRHAPPAPGAEVTVEANPGTVDPDKARLLRRLGVNRVSLGVQSLDDRLLERLGRVHDAAGARGVFGTLRKAGFANVAVDLIYGLPGQSRERWRRDLAEVVAWRPEHLSLYALSVEPGTPFSRAARRGTLGLPAEEEVVAMYRDARRLTAAAGYEHYEISNWARPGFRSRHNSRYWAMDDYRGVGAGAHSFSPGPPARRWANVADPAAYVRRWREGRSPVAMREMLPPRTLLAEAVMLGLRTREGILRRTFLRRFGVDPLNAFEDELSASIERGWLSRARGRLRLTERGVLFSNELFAPLF